MEIFVGQHIFCWSQFDLSIVHCIAKAYGWSTLQNRPKTRDLHLDLTRIMFIIFL